MFTYNFISIFQVEYQNFRRTYGTSGYLKLVQRADVDDPKSTETIDLKKRAQININSDLTFRLIDLP